MQRLPPLLCLRALPGLCVWLPAALPVIICARARAYLRMCKCACMRVVMIKLKEKRAVRALLSMQVNGACVRVRARVRACQGLPPSLCFCTMPGHYVSLPVALLA